MDWIERFLGFSPDGGDGSVEFMIVVVATLCAAAAIASHQRPRRALRAFTKRVRAGR